MLLLFPATAVFTALTVAWRYVEAVLLDALSVASAVFMNFDF